MTNPRVHLRGSVSLAMLRNTKIGIYKCSLMDDEALRQEYWNYLWIDANDFSTLVAVVSKYVFIAFYAVRMIIPENVTVACKRVVAVMTKHFFFVKGSIGRLLEIVLLVKCLVFISLFSFLLLINIFGDRYQIRMWPNFTKIAKIIF